MAGGPAPDEHPAASLCPPRLSPQSPCVFISVLVRKIEARRGTSGSSSRRRDDDEREDTWKLTMCEFEFVNSCSELDNFTRDSYINYYFDDINCGVDIGIGFIVMRIVSNSDVCKCELLRSIPSFCGYANI